MAVIMWGGERDCSAKLRANSFHLEGGDGVNGAIDTIALIKI